MTLADLKRNDVDGAVAYAKEYVAKNGALPPDEAEMLYMLQDNPDALADALRTGLVQAAPAAAPLRYP